MNDPPQEGLKSDFIVVQYLFDLDASGHYLPRLRIQCGAKTFTVADKDRRKYQELNDVLAADFEIAHRWQQHTHLVSNLS